MIISIANKNGKMYLPKDLYVNMHTVFIQCKKNMETHKNDLLNER